MKKKSGKKKKKLFLAALVFLALLAAACYTVFLKPGDNEEKYIYKETSVEFGDLVQGIMESGTVELKTKTQDYDVVTQTEESDDSSDDDDDDEDTKYLKVEEVYVSQGQRITAGDPVLKLTDKSIRSVRRSLAADQAEAQITLEEAQNEYEIEEASSKSDYQESMTAAAWSDAQYAVDTEKIDVQIAKLSDSIAVLQQEIEQIDTDLADSWDDYADLKEEYEKYKRRYEEWDKDNLYTYIPLRTDYLAAKEKYETETENRLDKREEMEESREEIAEKQEELTRLQGKTERSQMTARQDYESSVLSGQIAQEVYHYSLASLEENITQAEQEVKDLTETMDDFNAFVGEDGIVYAKDSGLITEVAYEEGDLLQEESSIITYVVDGEYVLSIDISEEDIPYVSVGDDVTIEFTAYPDETWTGKIQEITTTETSEDTATVSYPVTVKIDGDTTKLYGGMTGDVTFVTDQVDQVVYVSKKAVTRENNKSYVYIKNAKGDMEKKEIETGFSDGVSIQVVSGLSEGDTVYIASKISAGQSETELMQGEKAE